MVGIGVLMILTGTIALILFFKKRLFNTRWFHYWCLALTPSGFVAVLAGWFVTEIGRQPYVIYQVMRTTESLSPVPGQPIAISLAAFIFTYGLVFSAGTYYILHLIGKGPDTDEEAYGAHGVKEPPLFTGRPSGKGSHHV
jgi:cytochrome d ubiquinol oxidase subunit I